MSIKFLVFGGGGGGGILGFGGGVSADFIFMGARIFLMKISILTFRIPHKKSIEIFNPGVRS